MTENELSKENKVIMETKAGETVSVIGKAPALTHLRLSGRKQALITNFMNLC
jgi:hypothetical protein